LDATIIKAFNIVVHILKDLLLAELQVFAGFVIANISDRITTKVGL